MTQKIKNCNQNIRNLKNNSHDYDHDLQNFKKIIMKTSTK